MTNGSIDQKDETVTNIHAHSRTPKYTKHKLTEMIREIGNSILMRSSIPHFHYLYNEA
jgi:hypothetical protein